jgi:hypothetical protein
VTANGYQPLKTELRFVMFEADFTHEGDRCTFEVLLERTGIEDPALKPIAEIVDDIDLKDSRFQREETLGIERLIAGIAMSQKDDDERLARGAAVFDGLYEYFKRKAIRVRRLGGISHRPLTPTRLVCPSGVLSFGLVFHSRQASPRH